MSASIAIPVKKRDDGKLEFSKSVGGTIYATTPGGTRRIYTAEDMLKLSSSPLAKKPVDLPHIDGITKGGKEGGKEGSKEEEKEEKSVKSSADELFNME